MGLIGRGSGLLVPATLGGQKGSAGYTGPGDIVPGAFAWWGFRGYSAAYSTGSNPAMDVVDTATGLTTTTINILSNGSLDIATVLALGYPLSVKQLYDQTGNGRHLAIGTLANMPDFNGTGVYSMSVTNTKFLSTGNVSFSQPFSLSAVANRTADAGNGNSVVFQNGNTGHGLTFFTAGITPIGVNFGNALISSTSYTLNTFAAIQVLANGASSSIYVDGTSTAGNAGADVFSSEPIIVGAGRPDVVKFVEGGVWASNASASFSSINTNQHTAWGF